MPPTTKEAQRAELHRTIWRIANDLRGSVDGWDFKSYVLGMLFYRFISENLTAYLNKQERKAGNPDFDYTHLSHARPDQPPRHSEPESGQFDQCVFGASVGRYRPGSSDSSTTAMSW